MSFRDKYRQWNEKFQEADNAPVTPCGWKYPWDGKLEKVILVDYQTLHSGSAITDLLFFITCGTDGAFRRRHYKQLIDHYYEAFVDFLKKLGLDSNKLYPKEEFHDDLKESLPFGLLMAALALPMVLVEANNAPTFQADAKLSNFVAKPNEEFKRRLRDFIDDYMEWGVI
ncbi:hypothetical protein EVAR_86689_1 [Eumeta japonica]|uniref:CHK kinase-like domain-containing protein n=1 Tax=Eumeta variegata TaxID=151549 RepID=A0A4C1XXL9_EUMVA|nr:hypothetical protein EVAR_86689_1 [Eumeta japonica]